ncbi:MAG: FAD binding domain-containing protein [Clostridium fessum]
MIWLKMSRGNVGTAIDISGLGLDQIEETEDAFEIGAMVTLRQLEEHPGLAAYTDGAMRESVRHIVGVQLRSHGDSRRQYLWQIWIFRCPDNVMAMDTEVETLQSWTDAVGGICKTDRRSGHFSQINCP